MLNKLRTNLTIKGEDEGEKIYYHRHWRLC